jgi:hypothetical protein
VRLPLVADGVTAFYRLEYWPMKREWRMSMLDAEAAAALQSAAGDWEEEVTDADMNDPELCAELADLLEVD